VPIFRQRQGLTFMHDNARPHTAIVTRQFLQQNNVPVLQWPARSPDCNRSQLGYVNVIMPVDELSKALLEEWNNIPRRVYRNLCTSMTRRVQAVLNSNGGHTRY